MKQLILLFFSSSGILMAQSILPPEFSHDSGFYTEEFDLILSHENPEVKIIYTLDGSEPSIDNLQGRFYQYKKKYPLYPGQQPFEFYTNELISNVYDAPLLITDMTNKPNRLSEIATSNEFYHYFPTHNLFKGNVIRAKAYLNGEASETVTKNMFVTEEGANKFSLPIFSLSIDEEELFGYDNGLFVAGRLFDEWRLANPNTLVTDAQPDANYLQSGSSSERKLNMNFFNKGISQLNHYVGIRNHGNFSRHFNNRSFRFYAKSDYGESKMNFPFFEDYDYNSFKRLILRNSGNDTFGTMFKDAYIQTLTKHLPFEFQAYQPSVVFVNAEYFGLFNLRERYDAKYFERIYNIKEKDLDILESQGIVDTGDDVAFVEMITFLNNNDLDSEENYNWLDKRVDIENFTDYYITEIFVGNTDWPVNNYEYWRKRVQYSEDAAYGHDGKFRWMLKDTDISYYPKEVNNNGLEHAFDQSTPSIARHTLLINKLVTNEKYKAYFINRFADLVNTTFNADRSVNMINEFAERIQPEINDHILRWKKIQSYDAWLQSVEDLRVFASQRPFLQFQHINSFFNLDGIINVTIRTENESQGFVKLNSLDINNSTVGIDDDYNRWIGQYFRNIPIKLEAVALPGFKFSHWSGSVESTEQSITVSPEASFYAKAHFVIDALSTGDLDKIDFMIYPNPVKDELNILSLNTLSDYKLYSLDGRLVKEGVLNNKQMNVSFLPKGIYLLELQIKGKRVVKKLLKN